MTRPALRWIAALPFLALLLAAGCGPAQGPAPADRLEAGQWCRAYDGWLIYAQIRDGDALSFVSLYAGPPEALTCELHADGAAIRRETATGETVLDLEHVFADPAPGRERGAAYLDRLTLSLGIPHDAD